MVSAGNVDMLSRNDGLRGFDCSLEDNLQNELELLLRSQRSQQGPGREAELHVYRSGSAPPTVEGSRHALGGLLGNSSQFRDGSGNPCGDINWEFPGDDDVHFRSAYLSHHSSENLNPGMPSSLMLKEDRRVSQRLQAGGSVLGGVRDLGESLHIEDGSNSSLFSIQPGSFGLSTQDATDELMQLRRANRLASVEWLGRGSNGLNGLPVSGMGARMNSFADMLQDGPHQRSCLSSLCPRPQSCNAIGDTIDPIIASPSRVDISPGVVSSDGLYFRGDSPGLTDVPSRCISAPIAPSFSRNMTNEAKLAGMPCSSNFPRGDGWDAAGGPTIPSGHGGIDDILAPFSDLNMSKYREYDEERLLPPHLHMALDNQVDNYRQLSNLKVPPGFGSSSDLARKGENLTSLGFPGINARGQQNFPKHNSPSAHLYRELAASDLETIEGYNGSILNSNLDGHHAGSHYSLDEEINSKFANGFCSSQLNLINGELMQRYEHESGNDLSRVQHIPRSTRYVKPSLSNRNNLSQIRNHFGSSPDMTQLRKAYLEALVAQQKEQDSLHMGKLPPGMDQKQRGSLSFRLLSQHFRAAPGNSVFSPVGYGSHIPHDDRIAHISSLTRSSMGDMTKSRTLAVGGNLEGRFVSSVLDEFKNNKARSFELADILDHVVEFSSDQYGSRFIQQKLETASEVEKEKIFPKILLHARSLMTDVFGNYVIQKFFDHGSESQRKELACQLTGHVLPLSLQMYGCRVIQKALEVIDVEQQTEMVAELDGFIMKCVRDQNGNHVIQKCIECIPQDRIQFMISAFFGQVVLLSMHPYGCRVIQRVLEYCNSPNTQETIMEEILQSVYTLAQDQYGNYVIQHVLEHGKPHERATIMSKLSGHFVKMSQQKFASNVVEKCLTFGSPEDREALIQEMLGSTDENEPLQAMMKDPFGNYVVQKVLEICDDQTLEFILSRIKVHLNTLTRYTYGKHIVSRVEKLITTGERRIGLSTSLAA